MLASRRCRAGSETFVEEVESSFEAPGHQGRREGEIINVRSCDTRVSNRGIINHAMLGGSDSSMNEFTELIPQTCDATVNPVMKRVTFSRRDEIAGSQHLW